MESSFTSEQVIVTMFTSLATIFLAQSNVPVYKGTCPGCGLTCVCNRTLTYQSNLLEDVSIKLTLIVSNG